MYRNDILYAKLSSKNCSSDSMQDFLSNAKQMSKVATNGGGRSFPKSWLFICIYDSHKTLEPGNLKWETNRNRVCGRPSAMVWQWQRFFEQVRLHVSSVFQHFLVVLTKVFNLARCSIRSLHNERTRIFCGFPSVICYSYPTPVFLYEQWPADLETYTWNPHINTHYTTPETLKRMTLKNRDNELNLNTTHRLVNGNDYLNLSQTTLYVVGILSFDSSLIINKDIPRY